MKQFIYDIVRMPNCEWFMKYWWLIAIFFVIQFIAMGFAYGFFKFRGN